MVKKYPIVAGLIILLVLLAGVWYFKSPTDTSPDLKTYRNDKYGVEFKYPQKYTLTHNGSETRRPTPHIEDLDITDFIRGKGSTWVARLNIRHPHATDVDNLQYPYEEWMPGLDFNIISRKKIFIDNKETLVETTRDEDGDAVWVHTINKNLLYTWIFSGTTTEQSQKELRGVQKIILDSFKLTK